MKAQRILKPQSGFSAQFFCLFAVVSMWIGTSGRSGPSAPVNTQPIQQSSETGGKHYLEMSEEEKEKFIAQNAEDNSYALGNDGGMSVRYKITPEAVAAIKPFVDAYAKRRVVAGKKTGCDFEREQLSMVLARWLRDHKAIEDAFDAERDLDKPVPDQQWDWVSPRMGVYLAMVESELCPCLKGADGKLGPFQLTRESAAKYGLKLRAGNSSQGVDERCEVAKAATAAAKHLKSLAGAKNDPLRTLFALARYHRGSNVSLPTEDPYWAFVSRPEFRAAAAETLAFEFIQKIFAASILIENPEFFDDSLPPEASGEARREQFRQQLDSKIEESLRFALVSVFVQTPQRNFEQWLKRESQFGGDWERFLEHDPVRLRKSAESNRALNQAPDWLRNLTSNLSRIRDYSGRIISHQFHDQTVYQLKADIMGVLYDQRGRILCAFNQMEEKGDAAEKCPDFNLNQSGGKLIWESLDKR